MLSCDVFCCAGGGLSSSAAIVCSSALAIAAALDLTSHFTKGAVSEFTCTSERYVGVTSGGMDQAISVMGMPGLALLVEFNPVRPASVDCMPGASVSQAARSLAFTYSSNSD